MIREKRICKQPVPYLPIYPEPKKHPNKAAKKYRKFKRCEYKMIPLPTKFNYNAKILPLYGDIILIEKHGMISTELSVFNKFKHFRNIEVSDKTGTKLIHIMPKSKEEPRNITWRQIVKKLEASESLKLKIWANIIKEYSTNYENLVQEYEERNNNAIKIEVKEEVEYRQISERSENQKRQIFQLLPSVCLEFRFSGSNIELVELIFNEAFLHELGYSTDSFVTTVFQEGLPQMSPSNNETMSSIFKLFLENFFSIGESGIVTQEYNLSLFMKCDYIKNVQARGYFLANYEDGKYGADLIISITSKEQPYLNYKHLHKQNLNKEFITEMTEHEKLLSKFLSAFYDTSFTLRYTNIGKVCTVKELPLPMEEDLSFSNK